MRADRRPRALHNQGWRLLVDLELWRLKSEQELSGPAATRTLEMKSRYAHSHLSRSVSSPSRYVDHGEASEIEEMGNFSCGLRDDEQEEVAN